MRAANSIQLSSRIEEFISLRKNEFSCILVGFIFHIDKAEIGHAEY
jgi:hypothetical protein